MPGEMIPKKNSLEKFTILIYHYIRMNQMIEKKMRKPITFDPKRDLP